MKVSDRVFHTGVVANGVITEVDETKQNPYKVQFFWAKYTNVLHGSWRGSKRPERKWQWCSRDSLEKTLPEINEWDNMGPNKVTTLGGRSLDILMRNVCELDRRQKQDNSDIIINYGQNPHRLPGDIMVINRKVITNKLLQCQLMGEELSPKSEVEAIGDNVGWIIKPHISIGGKDIRRYYDDEIVKRSEYVQEFFPKDREFRTHCFLWMDKPIQLIQEKRIENKDQLCWNKKQGATFYYVYQDGLNVNNLRRGDLISGELINKLSEMSVLALKLLGYDFGGLDFGMDKNGNLKIFEVNSRMGVREQTLFTYKRAFNLLRTINIDQYRNERWR